MMVMSMDMKRTAASEQRLHTPSVTVLQWVFEQGCDSQDSGPFWIQNEIETGIVCGFEPEGMTNEIVTKWHSLSDHKMSISGRCGAARTGPGDANSATASDDALF